MGEDTDFVTKAIKGEKGVFIMRWTRVDTRGSSFIQSLEWGLETVQTVESIL